MVDAGIILLGSPVGDQQWEGEVIRSRIEKVRNITEHLPHLKDPHTEFVLLRSCLGLPKVMHLLHSVDPTHHQLLWSDFDRVTREALTRILGASLTNLQWRQAKLPVTLGGLGMRAAEDHGAGAHAASLLSSQALVVDLLDLPEDTPVTLSPALLQQISRCKGEVVIKEDLEDLTQKEISLATDLNNHILLTEHYIKEGEQREVARLNCLGLDHAGDWLNVVPCPSMGLHLRSLEFTLVNRYHLGMNV